MVKEEILPYLNRFITLILINGSEHTGFVANSKAVKEAPEGEDVQIQLINGIFHDEVWLSEVAELRLPAREETVSIPIKDIKEGYHGN